MNADRLLAHYEMIADAPHAIPRLRRFVLDLAVRGKLAPQDPNDEPASELLKRIAEEKRWLVRKGKIRKQKILLPVHRGDIPVENIPDWNWVRLGEVSTLITKGSTPTSYGHAYTPEGVNFVKVESIKDGSLLPENITSFIADETHDFLARSQLAAGDLLFSIAGSIGTCAVVTDQILPANTNQALAIIRGTQTVFFVEFLLKSLQSSVAQSVSLKARGGAMNNISLTDIRNLIVPLPPLPEQHRIVAKVDELMALCDRLEAAHTEREETRDLLSAGSLARLNAPDSNPAVFRRHATFALDNLVPLTTRPDQIKALRQTILNLAVRGKLVPQDPNDEPATESLKRIAAEKARLVKEGLTRKTKRSWLTDDDSLLFESPLGWMWSRLGEITRKIHYGFTASANPNINTVRLLRITDIQNNSVEWNSVPGCEIGDKTLPKFKLESGDILVARTGGTIGKSYLVTELPVVAVFASYLIRVQGSQEIYTRYLKLFFESPIYWTQLQEGARGAGQPNVNGRTLGKLQVPIPPLPEQCRIVAKVDELMALCDQMETELATTDAIRTRLLDSLLHEALGSAFTRYGKTQ